MDQTLGWAVRENILSDIENIFFTELKEDLGFRKVNGSEWTLNGEQEKTAKWNKVQESRTKLTKKKKVEREMVLKKEGSMCNMEKIAQEEKVKVKCEV